MDKKNILRSYAIRSQKYDNKGTIVSILTQFSQLDGEFGPVEIVSAAELDGDKPAIHCWIQASNGTSSEKLFSIRNAELAHFVLNILPLFNPLTFNKDALPFQEKE